MFDFSVSEWLFYGGIAAMVVIVILTVLSGVIFAFTGRRLKKKLEQEYGSTKY